MEPRGTASQALQSGRAWLKSWPSFTGSVALDELHNISALWLPRV